MFSNVQIRIIANACIARFNRGEGTIETVVNSYKMSEENKTAVKEQISSNRPDILGLEAIL